MQFQESNDLIINTNDTRIILTLINVYYDVHYPAGDEY